MAQRIVGIDISARAARVVVLETTLRKTEVAQLATVPVNEGEARKDVLQAVRAAVPGPIDTLVISADPRLASTRLLHFPFTDLRKVESAVEFELESQVPYEMEKTAITWQVVAHSGSSTDVLAALMPKAPLAELIAEAEGTGLEPRAVIPGEVGLRELLLHHGHEHAHEPLAVAALGDNVTHVVVVRGGIRYVRTLRAGGQDIDRALAKAFGVDLVQAKAAKEGDLSALGPSGAEEARVQQAVAQGLGPLVTGLSTTFKSLAALDAPLRLHITGGLSRLHGLPDFLSQKLGIPVELIDLAAAVEAAGPHFSGDKGARARTGRPRKTEELDAVAPALVIGPEYAVALGLAIAKLRHGRGTPLNFRRGALAYQGDIQLYRGHVVRIAAGLGILFVLAIAGSIVRYSMISAEEKRINAAFCLATKKIVGREICDPTAALATLRQAPGASEGVVIPQYSAATLFEMMSKSVGSDIDVTFSDLEFRVDGRAGEPDRISGKGEAANFEAGEQIAAALKRDPCVQDVEVSNQRKARDGGRVEFNLGVKVSCPSGALPGQGKAKGPSPAGPAEVASEGGQP